MRSSFWRADFRAICPVAQAGSSARAPAPRKPAPGAAPGRPYFIKLVSIAAIERDSVVTTRSDAQHRGEVKCRPPMPITGADARLRAASRPVSSKQAMTRGNAKRCPWRFRPRVPAPKTPRRNTLRSRPAHPRLTAMIPRACGRHARAAGRSSRSWWPWYLIYDENAHASRSWRFVAFWRAGSSPAYTMPLPASEP